MFPSTVSQANSETSEENTDSDGSNTTPVKKARVKCRKKNSPTTNLIQSDHLIGVLRERNSNVKNDKETTTKRQQIRIEPKANKVPFAKEVSPNYVQVQVHQEIPIDRNYTTELCSSNAPGKQKIPRPANAFMLFANEWRKKLALKNPKESNKDISVRQVTFFFFSFIIHFQFFPFFFFLWFLGNKISRRDFIFYGKVCLVFLFLNSVNFLYLTKIVNTFFPFFILIFIFSFWLLFYSASLFKQNNVC